MRELVIRSPVDIGKISVHFAASSRWLPAWAAEWPSPPLPDVLF